MKLSTAQSCLLARARRAHPTVVSITAAEDRTARVLQRAGLVVLFDISTGRFRYRLTPDGLKLADELRLTYLRSSFAPRDLPEAIWIGEEVVVGPFCVHCGNPLTLHGPDDRCPDRTLHPVFPPPSCRCHRVAATV